MKQNIKQSLKFSLPVFIFLTVIISVAAGFEEGVISGLLIGLLIGLLVSLPIALVVAFIYSESTKEFFADICHDKESRSRMGLNVRQLIPVLFIILMGAVLTRFTGKIYLMLIASVALSIVLVIFQSVRTGNYKKAVEEKELVTFYGSFVVLTIPFISMFFIFLFLVYFGNVMEIIKLF
ncbi:MAG TPA: hypothetical protein ENH31_05190 [Nitrospirae bacterium]|nr:hypothetical protein BMS3Abin10_02476 [bacterium BMS3Abin10]GBE39405.1 hypothetical protein BMS3Bbin08_02027 [bacterium BMS3Bbin08]HDK81948.1 hypothetical protein [Nitrospirota bacterium]